MKSKFLLALAIAGFIAPSFCIASPDATQNTSKQGQAVQTTKDGEIIAIVVGLNKNEIGAASVAVRKAQNPAVKKYAEMMRKEHSQNLLETLKISKKFNINPIQSATSKEMKQNGRKELIILTQQNGNQFDRVYIEAMVKGHTAALKLIDDDLMKNASNPAVMNHLKNTRPHVAQHLKEAQKIQSKLK